MQQIRDPLERGSVTIYMSLILAVLLSLFISLIESARVRAVWLVADCGVDLAVYSVFAEYNRKLFEEYDLLFVDSSYGTAETSDRLVKQHLQTYINENLSAGRKGSVIATDLTQTFLEQLDIDQISYATDEDCGIFERQATDFIKQKYGVAYIQAMQREFKKADENGLFTRDVASERESNESELSRIREEGIETGEVDEEGNPIKEEIEFENPADNVNAGRALGILSLIDPPDGVSQKGVKENTLLSHRDINKKGDGYCDRNGCTLTDKLWFELYIKEHCGCYTNRRKEGVLEYQMEYIIAGKDNDTDNLKSVVNRLLMIREAANVAYLFSDPAKTAEAETLALTIATAAGAPLLTEPLKISLMFAWAYAESVWDVRCLLSGRKVSVIKTAVDWHFSLEGMMGYLTEGAAAEGVSAAGDLSEDSDDGLSGIAEGKLGYEEYLMLLLTAEGEKKTVKRMMDIAEMDVRSHSGDYGFCLDDCFEHMKIEAIVSGKRGGTRKVTRDFSYT